MKTATDDEQVTVKRNVTVSGPVELKPATPKKLFAHKRSHTYNGPTTDLYKYCSKEVPVTYRSKELTLSDLTTSADRVIQDTLAMEKTLHGLTSPQPKQVSRDSPPKTALEPIMKETNQMPLSRPKKPGPVKALKTNAKIQSILRAQLFDRSVDECGRCILKTGVDVVYAFAKNALPSDTQEVYLRCLESTPFNPYALTVVPKTACPASTEYYVATKFGFLQVYPDGDCSQQSFAGWMRDSMLFNIIRNIPVFRDYLVRKMLRLWHKNVCMLHYTVNRRRLYHAGLCFYPPFSLALWKVNSLCQDLLTLELHSVTPLGNYDKESLSIQFKMSKLKVFKYIQKFFKYSQRAINEIVSSTYSRVLELETQKRHAPFVSDLPISVQRERHLQLERDLEESLHRRAQLEKLCITSQQIVTSHLMDLVNKNAKEWLDIVSKERASKGSDMFDDDDDDELKEGMVSEVLLDVDSYTDLEKQLPSLLKAELLVTDEGIHAHTRHLVTRNVALYRDHRQYCGSWLPSRTTQATAKKLGAEHIGSLSRAKPVGNKYMYTGKMRVSYCTCTCMCVHVLYIIYVCTCIYNIAFNIIQ